MAALWGEISAQPRSPSDSLVRVRGGLEGTGAFYLGRGTLDVTSGGEGAYLRSSDSASTLSLTNALVGGVELGSSKKVRLVIKSEVLHIATSIGHVSSSYGNLTSPEYLVSVNTWL